VNTKEMIKHLQRIENNKKRFLNNVEGEEGQTVCCFISNEDRTCSPCCESGVVVKTSIAFRWIEESSTCPFCGLTSGFAS
jgi:hypothetical protein